MPRQDHRLSLRERFSPQERAILTVMLGLVNELRQRIQLDVLTEAEVLPLLRQALQGQREGRD